MSRNDRQQSVIAARRLAVEPLAIQRVSARQIAELIGRQGFKQPESEEPWSYRTIARDVQFLERQWTEQAKTLHAEAKGRILAQYRETQRQGWLMLGSSPAARDKIGIYRLILEACTQECKLLGLDAPTKIDITTRLREIAASAGYDPDDAIREAEAIVRGYRS